MAMKGRVTGAALSLLLLAGCGPAAAVSGGASRTAPVLTVTPTPVVRPAVRIQTRTVTVSVPAVRPWVPTGVTVAAGDTVALTAAGTIGTGSVYPPIATASPRGLGQVSATGHACTSNRHNPQPLPYLVARVPCESLVAALGTPPPAPAAPSARVREIGTGTAFTAPVSGPLFLSVNDNYFPDNSGAWRVTITVRHPTVRWLTTTAPRLSAADRAFAAGPEPAAGSARAVWLALRAWRQAPGCPAVDRLAPPTGVSGLHAAALPRLPAGIPAAVRALAAQAPWRGMTAVLAHPKAPLSQGTWLSWLVPCAARGEAVPAPNLTVLPMQDRAVYAVGGGWLAGVDAHPDPPAQLSEAAALTLLIRAVGLGAAADVAGQQPAPVAATAPSWARGPATLALALGIVPSTGPGAFRPDADLTAAVGATWIARALARRTAARTSAGTPPGAATGTAACSLGTITADPAYGPPGTSVTLNGMTGSVGAVWVADPSVAGGWVPAPITAYGANAVTVTMPPVTWSTFLQNEGAPPAGPTVVAVVAAPNTGNATAGGGGPGGGRPPIPENTSPGGSGGGCWSSTVFTVTNYAYYTFFHRAPANPWAWPSPSADQLMDTGRSPTVTGGVPGVGAGNGWVALSFSLNEYATWSALAAALSTAGGINPPILAAAPGRRRPRPRGLSGAFSWPAQYTAPDLTQTTVACGAGSSSFVFNQPWIWGFRLLYARSGAAFDAYLTDLAARSLPVEPAPLLQPTAVWSGTVSTASGAQRTAHVWAIDVPAVYMHVPHSLQQEDRLAQRRDLGPQSIELTGLAAGSTYVVAVSRIYALADLPPTHLNTGQTFPVCAGLPIQVPYPSFQTTAAGQLATTLDGEDVIPAQVASPALYAVVTAAPLPPGGPPPSGQPGSGCSVVAPGSRPQPC